jgi:hypothetical protein
VISVLFIGVGLVIFRMTAPNLGIFAMPEGMTIGDMLLGFFGNRGVLISLLVSAIIVIFFLALKIAGVFGK